jgi:hypothetical protein
VRSTEELSEVGGFLFLRGVTFPSHGVWS